MSAGQDAYKLSFQVSPIILVGGAAALIPGGMIPIVALTNALSYTAGLLSGGNPPSLDNFFAAFEVMSGGTLIENAIGHYPFANQAVAANAIIAQPLKVSLSMHVPVRDPGGYATKLATMIALQTALKNHNGSGGTYAVATPSFIYTSCIMTSMRDVTARQSKQLQTDWQIDFEQPLLTEAQADQALNSLMGKINSQTSIDGDPSWTTINPTVGQPNSLATPNLVPTARSPVGSNALPQT